MQYTSNDKIIELIDFIIKQGEFIIESTKQINSFEDFKTSLWGVTVFNSTCMCLQTIGETINKIDQASEKKVLRVSFPEYPWVQVIALRNIISHDYQSIDEELVLRAAKEEIPGLLLKIQEVRDYFL